MYLSDFESTNTNHRVQLIQLCSRNGMSEERLDDTCYCDHTSNNSIESSKIRQSTSSVLLFGHSDWSELILEIHTRRSTTEEGRTIEELFVLCHTILIILTQSTMERNRLNRNEFEEIGYMIHFYTSDTLHHTYQHLDSSCNHRVYSLHQEHLRRRESE